VNARTTAAVAMAVAMLGCGVAAASASADAGLAFTDWTSNSAGVTDGTLLGAGVELAGPPKLPSDGTVLDGTYPGYGDANFTPPVTATDTAYLVANPNDNGTYTLDFSSPVTDPVFDFASLGSIITFPAGTVLERVSGDSGFAVSGNVVTGQAAPVVQLGDSDSNGTLRLDGTVSSLTLKIGGNLPNPAALDGVYMQIGAAPAPLSPPPSTPPPPPPPPPIVISPAAQQVAAGGFDAVLATVPDPQATINWDVTGDGKIDAQCPASKPLVLFQAPLTLYSKARAITSLRITATAIVPGQAPSATTTLVGVTPSRLPASFSLAEQSALVAQLAHPTVVCAEPPPALAGGTSVSALPPDFNRIVRPYFKCIPAEIAMQVVRVSGCFKPVTRLADIPAPDVPQLEHDVVTSGHLDPNPDGLAARVDAWLSNAPGWVSLPDIAVRVNGIVFSPGNTPANAIVIHPTAQGLLTAGAAIYAGGVRLSDPRPFDLALNGSGSIPLGSFPHLPTGLQAIGGLPLVGDMTVSLQGGATLDAHAEIAAHVQLPPALFGAQAAFTGRVDDNGNFNISSFTISAPSLQIGPVGLQDFRVQFNGSQWIGQGKICITTSACISAEPADGGGITIGPGSAFAIKLSYSPQPPVPLGTDVDLTQIRAGVGYPPLRFTGGASVTVGSLLQIDGNLVLAFASSSPGQQYTLQTDRATLGDGLRPQDYTTPLHSFTLALTAQGSLLIPVIGKLPLANAHFLYVAPGFVDFGAAFHISVIDVITVDGQVDGTISFTQGRFQVFGDMHACIFGIICSGGQGIISDRGVGACVQEAFISLGGGEHFKPSASSEFWPIDGCRWSPFADQGITARAARAGGVQTIPTQAGDPAKVIELHGTTGAPSVRVTTADGASADSPAGTGVGMDTTTRKPRIVIMRSEPLKLTTIGIETPATGVNRIKLLPGSSPIAHVREAADQPQARITAFVRGSGSERHLIYDLDPRTAQTVTFYERAGSVIRPLGTVTGGRGDIAFAPQPGRGTHMISAQFTLDGLPAERMTVARFTPPSPRLARAGQVAARHAGATVRVTWRPVSQATGYDVVLTAASGGQIHQHTSRPSATFRRVVEYAAGRVAVQATAPQRTGPSATERFRADGKRPRGLFHPLKR
jgi:hypothetical protein